MSKNKAPTIHEADQGLGLGTEGSVVAIAMKGTLPPAAVPVGGIEGNYNGNGISTPTITTTTPTAKPMADNSATSKEKKSKKKKKKKRSSIGSVTPPTSDTVQVESMAQQAAPARPPAGVSSTWAKDQHDSWSTGMSFATNDLPQDWTDPSLKPSEFTQVNAQPLLHSQSHSYTHDNRKQSFANQSKSNTTSTPSTLFSLPSNGLSTTDPLVNDPTNAQNLPAAEQGKVEVLKNFYVFAEDNVSTLSGRTFGKKHRVAEMSNAVKTASFVSENGQEVPLGDLVEYLVGMGTDHKMAEDLALKFAQDQQAKQKGAPDGLFRATGGNRNGRMQSVLEEHPSSAIPHMTLPESSGNDEEFIGGVYASEKERSISACFQDRSVRRVLLIILAILGLVIAVGLGVGFAFGGDDSTSTPAQGSDRDETSDPPDTITNSPSSSPTIISMNYLNAATALSGEGVLQDQNSPQYKAVGWMSTFDNVSPGSFGRAFSQRYGLVVMYYSLQGEGWVNRDRWLDPDVHECNWSSGIFCQPDDEFQVVTGVTSERNNLRGSLPAEIGLLVDAQSLRFPNNMIGGTIPRSIGDMVTLSAIDLSSNEFSGSIPPEISTVSDLLFLDLSMNSLTSTIPSDLYSLPFLRTLKVSFNKITGNIVGVGNLQALANLELQNNFLSGNLPSELALISTLDAIRLDHNEFTGTLPLFDFTAKQLFSVSFNKFTGSLTTSGVVSTSRIEFVDISHNELTGSIRALGALSSLHHLDISGNSLTGTFPSNFGWPELEYMDAASNSFAGTVPVGWSARLTHLDMSENLFALGIPEGLCDSNPDLQYLLLGQNELGSTIPECLASLRKLRDLSVPQSDIFGSIPTWLGSLPELQILDLADNTITGTIPDEMGGATMLQHLRLGRNLLSGFIPSILGSLRLLSSLNFEDNAFTGTVPSVLSSLSNLEILTLKGNNLRGSIPDGLCDLPGLTVAAEDVGCDLGCGCCTDSQQVCV